MRKEFLILESLKFKGDCFKLFRRLRHHPHAFLLESSLRHKDYGRYSFMGCDPFFVFKGDGRSLLPNLRKHFEPFHFQKLKCPTPFPAGILGYLSYDYGLSLEHVGSVRRAKGIFDGWFGFYDTVITIDHQQSKIFICSSGWPERKLAARKIRAQKRLQEIISCLEKEELPEISIPLRPSVFRLQSNFSKGQYVQAVQKAKEYIRAGDIYQVNLSQRFHCDLPSSQGKEDSLKLYEVLKSLSPAAFSSYLDVGGFQIISSSPERFLSLRENLIQTRPMKGTRPRGENQRDDWEQRESLLHSSKEKAELLMITDLERNDLGRVCDFGSVQVERLRTLERYKTVHQATSTISGRLRKDKDCFDLLGAAFPGGSITGCPKIRAMQIIQELEKTPRGIYTGCLGYVSFDRNMDFNILIRTLLRQDSQVAFQVGSGIVADSKPNAEYQETLDKAKALKECLLKMTDQTSDLRGQNGEKRGVWIYWDGEMREVPEAFCDSLTPGRFSVDGVFETMLFHQGNVVLLERHLKRFVKGAVTVGIQKIPTVQRLKWIIKDVIRKNGFQLARVRLMAWQQSSKGVFCAMVLPHQLYPKAKYEKGFHVQMAHRKICSDAKPSHVKSLDYGNFYQAYVKTKALGYDEVVFLNERGEVAEASRSNIFLVKDGQLLTPHLKSGALDGITRWQVIQVARKFNLRVQETFLTKVDLSAADEMFLTNSLLGVMPVTRLSGQSVADGRPGPITEQLKKKYDRRLN